MDNNSFAVGYALGWKRGSDSGGGGHIETRDTTYEDILANHQEIGTIWDDGTFKLTLNIWATENIRGGIPLASHMIQSNSNYPPVSGAFELVQMYYAVIILYKNGEPQYARLLNPPGNDSGVVGNSQGAYSTSFDIDPDGSGVKWYEWSRVFFTDQIKAGIFSTASITDFSFVTIGGLWDITGHVRFKISANLTADMIYALRQESRGPGGEIILSDWSYRTDTMTIPATLLDYTSPSKKGARVFPGHGSGLTIGTTFTNLSSRPFKALLEELYYHGNLALGANVEMPDIISTAENVPLPTN